MDRLRDSLHIEKSNGKVNEDFSLWSLREMSVLEERGLAGVVFGSERVLDKSDQCQYSVCDEKCRMATAVIVAALGDCPLPAV